MAEKSLIEMLGGVTRFGRLTVEGEAEPYRWRHRAYRMARCRCDCGVVKSVQLSKLRCGETVSCGCYAAFRASAENRTHGMTRSREYRSWGSMIARCENPAATSFAAYGGRGITVCERWRNSFEAFFADMGPRPDGMSLDRIDGAQGYEPGNCRWAGAKVQSENRSTTHFIEVRGRSLSISEASREFGVMRKTIRQRLAKGMTPEEAVGAQS